MQRVFWRSALCATAAAIAVVWFGAAYAVAVPGLALSVPGRMNAHVSMAARGSFVAAVWAASMPSGSTDIYAAVSRDRGTVFSAPVRVNSTAGDARVNGEQPPRIALSPAAGGDPGIDVIWTSKGALGTTLLSSRSTDGGRTFSQALLVPGTDAPGNRGWEALGVSPEGRRFAVWLDHRRLAEPREASAPAHHPGAAAGPAAPAAKMDGVAMAQLSQLYVASLDGGVPQAVTGGVCYCCKTAIAFGGDRSVYLAWRHVYPGNLRDMAFSVSRDGGRTFAAPARVSEDQWQLEGCPDDGPSMAVDARGRVHIAWPAVVTEASGPVKALFHAMSSDGRRFTPRQRIPTENQANHPQLAVAPDGTLALVWDESGTGTRRLASARGVLSGSSVRWERSEGAGDVGTYPVVVSLSGGWLRAWTSAGSESSVIQIAAGL